MNAVDSARGMGERLYAAGAFLLIGLLLQTVCTIVYRYWLHPLSKFPGPFLNAVSDVSYYPDTTCGC